MNPEMAARVNLLYYKNKKAYKKYQHYCKNSRGKSISDGKRGRNDPFDIMPGRISKNGFSTL